ncbi:hypothetical protein ACJMK2_014626 [Sinanodonta woodiana]|uniref:Uncharacterized protein n=1 Tax=Sinanodonta woodiana TaxID=1069815 RepID=A0ABD3V4H0_SINWO
MPIKVYIWNFQGPTEALGHASMSLSDGTHISWWPRGGNEGKYVKGNAVKAPPVHCMTLKDDIEGEDGKQPDVIRTIPPGHINEDDIKTWWESFSKEENWRLFGQNCSTVVYMALRAGSALDVFPAAAKSDYESVLIWTPGKVDTFVQRLIESITLIVEAEKASGCFAWIS